MKIHPLDVYIICIYITITKSETLYLKFSQISLSSKSYCSKSSSGPMEILSATIIWFQIIKIRNPKDRARPSSPWGLRLRLSTPTTGFEPATFRLIAGCATAAPHGLVWCFLTQNWSKYHKFYQVKMLISKWLPNSRGNA